MIDTIYSHSDSEYAPKKTTWHTEDSPWKATQIMKMMSRNNLQAKIICEIVCGAGEILNQLHQNLRTKPRLRKPIG